MRNIVLLFLTIFILSCSSKKRISEVPNRSKQEVIGALMNRNVDFKWIDASMSASIVSPDESMSGSIRAIMETDSSILVTVKKFGIELSRIFVNPEGYTVLYRFEGVYESGSLHDVEKILSISTGFEDLQQLLVGNVILPDNDNMTFEKDSIWYVVSSPVDDLFIKYYMNAQTMEMDKMVINDRYNREVIAEYSDYRTISGVGRMPFHRKFTVPQNHDGKTMVTLKFSNIEVNVPKNISFSIPAKYEKIN